MELVYWKDGGSQSQSQSQSQGEIFGFLQPSQTQNKLRASSKPPSKTAKATARSQPQRRGRSQSALPEEGESEAEDFAEAIPKKKNGIRTTQAGGKGKGKAKPLFLPDDEDDQGEPSGEFFDLDIGDLTVDEEYDEPPPAKKAAKKAVASPRKKRAAALMDDDSDTGVTFRGFDSRKKAKAK